jgi:hypothetical protein
MVMRVSSVTHGKVTTCELSTASTDFEAVAFTGATGVDASMLQRGEDEHPQKKVARDDE